MPTFHAKKLLSIDNGLGNSRPIYWSVVDHETNTRTTFDTKLDALVYKNTIKHATLYFHWYENQFTNNHQEPIESYEDLKKQRAQEIRDQFDYVRLWYSGGSDSQTALNSFVKNNIHLDEIIVHLWPDHVVADPYMSSSREVLISALPYLDSIKHQIPNTKITKVVLNKDDYIKYMSGPDALGELPFVHAMDRGASLFQMSSSQRPWEKILESTEVSNYCDLYGGTKPMVCVKNNQYYFYMMDSGLVDFFLSTRAEDFFISKNNPKLFLKTVYMLVNFLKLQNLSEKEINYFHSNVHKTVQNSKLYNHAIGRDPVHDIALVKTDRGAGYQLEQHRISVQGLKQALFVQNMVTDSTWNKLLRNFKQSHKYLNTHYDFIWNLDADGNPDANLGYAGHVSLLHSLDNNLSYDNVQIFKDGFLTS
jgi:hypothetical protein